MPYDVTREGDKAPTETAQTLDHALDRARTFSKRQEGSLRWMVIEKDRTSSRVRALFRRGVMSWAKKCPQCGGDGSWCPECLSLGYVEDRT